MCVNYVRHYCTDLLGNENQMYVSYDLCANALRCLQNLSEIPEMNGKIYGGREEVV